MQIIIFLIQITMQSNRFNQALNVQSWNSR